MPGAGCWKPKDNMDKTIQPAQAVSGTITPPPDKSISHRAVIFSAVAEGESVVNNFLEGEDCLNTIKAFEAMGVSIKKDGSTLVIKGKGFDGLAAPKGALYAGNSGTTVRLLAGVLAGRPFGAEITGDESLSKRPMRRIIEPLRLMGAELTAVDDRTLPITIKGSSALKAIEYSSHVASAQVKSSVLLAGLQAGGATVYKEPVKSRDHTERMLKAYGADISVNGLTVTVKGPARLKAHGITVPGDISSAAFFMVAGCLASEEGINLKGVGVNPTRDGIIEVLLKMGAKLELSNRREVSGEPVADISVKRSKLKAADIGHEIIPRLIDELPVIALAAAMAEGTTVISGAKELRVKESDRIKTVSTVLRKMGARVEEREDGMAITGPAELHGADVDCMGDHRVAMTAAVAALVSKGETIIEDVACVDTSYPGFWLDLEKICRKK